MLSLVQGQNKAVAFLQRVACGNYTSPLLLVGSNGIGRRFSVTCLARQMFCTGDHTETCVCLHCTQMQHKMHRDFLVVQAESGKEIGIDAAREVVSVASSYPVLAPVRIILIDGADHLSSAAANALLKTIEEPSKHIRFFLTANSLEGVLPTIRSRCGVVPYNALPEEFVLAMLQGIESSPEKATALARLAEGSAGQALEFWTAKRLKLRDSAIALLQESASGNFRQIFSLVDSFEEDLRLGLRFLLAVLRDLLVLEQNAQDRLVNVDAVEALQALHSKLPLAKVERLCLGLQALASRQRSTGINLPFHLKTLLATTFV